MNAPVAVHEFFRGRMGIAVSGCLLILLAAAAYSPCLQNTYIWDDDAYVYENRTLLSADGLRRIWFEPDATPQYYPIVHTTYWLEYRLWGLDPAGYHATNILLHGLGAVLLWLLLRRLGVPAGWAVAALFAVHPVHVESVAWVTERKNVLSGVFYLGAALAYIRFAMPRFGRIGQYVLALVLFVCALLSKTVTCSLPAALLLVLWWKLPRIRWRDLAALSPLFAIGVAMGLYTAHLEKTHVGALGDMWDFTFIERCLIAGRAICFYAGKLVWPTELTFFYPRWEIDGTQAWQYAYPALAAGAAILLWVARHRLGRGPLVAFLFFGGTLFPALGFFDVYPMKFSFVADHFQYLASIGLIVLGAAAAHRLSVLFGRSGVILRRVLLAAVLAVFGFLAHEQCKIYKNPITLWTDTISKNPDAFLAHNNLGVLLHKEGKIVEAIAHFEEALRIDPNDDFAHTNMGMALLEQEKYTESITYFQRAVEIDHDNALAHNNWGVALGRLGRHEEAARQHAKALDIYRTLSGYRAGSAGEADALNNLGVALFNLGRAGEAVTYIGEALEINPGDPKARFNLGFIYQKMGRFPEALEQFQEVLRLVPDQGITYHKRARIEIERTQQLIRRG